MTTTIRVPFDELRERVQRILLRLGLGEERAALSARLIAETDRDGVRTHGIARLPRFVRMVELGRIVPTAVPERVAGVGGLERWRGHRGPGNLAAHAMTARAGELARQYGVGAVALADTTHWQRGGTYGWQAAEAGFALLAWTNTMPNLPAWGAVSASLGNNPLVVAIPGASSPQGVGDAGPVVLDIAMSQFSYGGLASYRARGEALPVPGGYDEGGELSMDAAAIERTQRALPIGYWKGSGLAFALDMLAAMLAGGLATHEIPADPLQETGLSQVFLAVGPEALSTRAEMERVVTDCIAALHEAQPRTPGQPPRFPGEGTLRQREESLRLGVAVAEPVWSEFLRLEQSQTARKRLETESPTRG